MVYDITDPENASFTNYINSRDFSEEIAGDDSPEGLCFISASDSKNGSAYLLAACEVSGTVAAYRLTSRSGSSSSSGGGHSGGSGSSTSSSYHDISVPSSVTGGEVSVSPSRAEEGDTVTIRITTESGFALQEITVTDEDGTELTLEREDDNTYTFTMPASDIDISAVFRATDDSEDTGAVTLPFTDVTEDSWYNDAVAYVYGHGLMTGTDSRTFSPDTVTTRGMIVTMLSVWKTSRKFPDPPSQT